MWTKEHHGLVDMAEASTDTQAACYRRLSWAASTVQYLGSSAWRVTPTQPGHESFGTWVGRGGQRPKLDTRRVGPARSMSDELCISPNPRAWGCDTDVGAVPGEARYSEGGCCSP